MKSIYKYPIGDDVIIEAPIEHILDVQIQNGELVAWATINDRQPNRKLLFKIFGTGWEFPDDFEFYGTKSCVCKQIGNAVPPKLAYFFAIMIRRLLNEN